MFLLKDRNATYYARFYFSQTFRQNGYPGELRFSLATKKRSEAIDRLLPVLQTLRERTKSLPISETPESFLNTLRKELLRLREIGFLLPGQLPTQSHHTSCTPEIDDSIQKQKYEDLLSLFLESKRAEKLLPRSIQQLESRISAFLKFSQKETSPTNATTKDAFAFRDFLLNSSKSEKSSLEYIAAAKQFYKWLVMRGDLTNNPFNNILIKRKKRRVSDERSRWTLSQLSTLFHHSNFAKLNHHGDKSRLYNQKEHEDFWLPLLLLYTGARVSEICQLNVQDVQYINGIWCLSINDNGTDKRLKTAAATRIIPIHPKLIELGFLDYLNMRKVQRATQLFSFKPYGRDKDWSKGFIIRFSKVLDKLGFVRGHRPTLHGLRHTFIDELQQRGTQEHIVAELVGHTKSGITFGRYAKQVNVHLLYEAVKLVTFTL
ncbi:site-specific integrase [Vibrio fluvialis]